MVLLHGKRSGPGRVGFTLIEVLVAAMLTAIAVAGVLGGIRALTKAQSQAQTADTLQRLAAEKMDDLQLLSDPTSSGVGGDFSDRGYQDVTWQVDEETTGTLDLDQVTVTVTRGQDSQKLTTLMNVSAGQGARSP